MENGVGYANHEFVPPTIKRSNPDSRFPVNAGITGYVAATGETLNIVDAYKDPRFDPVFINKQLPVGSRLIDH